MWVEEEITRNLEMKALKAFHEDTLSDDEFPEDHQMMGGEKEDQKKTTAKKQSFLDQINFVKYWQDKQKKTNDIDYRQMSQEQKDAHRDKMWKKLRRYVNQLRVEARLQKLADSNGKQIINEIDDEGKGEEELKVVTDDDQPRWYLVQKEGKVCQFWDFMITVIIIYNMFVTPFILVFSPVYQTEQADGSYITEHDNKNKQTQLKTLEYVFDVIYCLEILLNFFKKSREYRTLREIGLNYISFHFWFDILSTIPCLMNGENFSTYFFKCFKIVYFFRISIPLDLGLSIVLQKLSKQRQKDLTSFCALILYIIYTSHCCACFFIHLGYQFECKNVSKGSDGNSLCQKSWIYKYSFDEKTYTSIYIFAFYWIFEVITTVGYGDYVGATQNEYIFSVGLEFLGLVFFSFLMGSITSIFGTSDNFDDLIEQKLDTLDMWIKKIEKSNKPFHIQPTLYSDIRKYVEQAFLYDFNLVIEEFPFYEQITPKMQTQLIQSTRVFQEFERSFNHFFDECERGFTNEFIISMFCRIFQQNRVVISYKSPVKEMFFIRQGIVQVFNHEHDEITKDKTILYLPKFAYFGDFQILYKLKSNLVYKTLSTEHARKKSQTIDHIPDVYFMCVSKDKLLYFCHLFPQTAENIKRKSLERRKRFIQQKNHNSKSYMNKQSTTPTPNEPQASSMFSANNKTPTPIGEGDDDGHGHGHDHDDVDSLEDFMPDEEYENPQSQKEDMKTYLVNLNSKIDNLIDALEQSKEYVGTNTNERSIRQKIEEREELVNSTGEKVTLAEYFNQKVVI